MVSNSLWFHKLQHPKTKGNKIWNINRFYNGLKLVFLNRLSFKYELALWEILAMSALINVFFKILCDVKYVLYRMNDYYDYDYDYDYFTMMMMIIIIIKIEQPHVQTLSQLMSIAFNNSYLYLGVDDISCSVIFRPFKQ